MYSFPFWERIWIWVSGPHLGRVCMLAWALGPLFFPSLSHTRAHSWSMRSCGLFLPSPLAFATLHEHFRVPTSLNDRLASCLGLGPKFSRAYVNTFMLYDRWVVMLVCFSLSTIVGLLALGFVQLSLALNPYTSICGRPSLQMIVGFLWGTKWLLGSFLCPPAIAGFLCLTSWGP